MSADRINPMDKSESPKSAAVAYDEMDTPKGLHPDYKPLEKWMEANHYYSLCKYLARHTSHALPPGLTRPYTCQLRTSLRDHMTNVRHRVDVPQLLFEMVDCLQRDTTMILPVELYNTMVHLHEN